MDAAVSSQTSRSTQGLRPYPAYKDSGVEWLGKIPEHWKVRRLKQVSMSRFSSVDKHAVEGEQPIQLCNYTDVYYHDHITPDLDFMEATGTPEEIRRFEIKKGDVLVTKDSEGWDDIAVPALVVSDMEGVLCGYHLAQVRPYSDWMDGRYLFRAFSARGINDQFRVEATGITRYGLSKYALDNALFLVPPLPEQRAIATFLDRETAKIDALIAKWERMIALLQEKRAALINQAVTKGLDPNAPMKDSGVEWLGEVPLHWEVVPLKRLGDLQAGAGFPEEEQGNPSGDLPFFKVGDMGESGNEVYMNGCPNYVSREVARKLRAFIFPENTVVFAKVGAALLLNRRRLLCQDSCIDNNMMGFIPKSCDPKWAFYWLSGLDLRELANPGAVPSVNEGQMRDIPVSVPPEVEQQAIAKFLDTETAKVSSLIGKIESGIEKLREYRTALISAAVTGKIDVRGEAA